LFAVLMSASTPDAAAQHTSVRSLKEIREHRVVMQRWDVSCGAAALATVLFYGFGDFVTERDVATAMLGATDAIRVRVRGGFSLLDMQRYMQARGYDADGYRDMAVDNLLEYESPIVPITLNGFPHFVVFRGLTDDNDVLLADPAFGNRSVSLSKFNDIWTDGIAFVVTRKQP
jgi:uncharacterized protein